VVLTVLEKRIVGSTHIVISLLIFCLVLILMFRIAFTLMLLLALSHVLCLALLLVLYLSSLMDLTTAHMVLIHERTTLSLRRFGYDPRPHRAGCFPCRPDFLTGESFPHLEPRHLDGPRFSRRGSHPTRLSGEVQRTVKTYSGRMVKCWISKIYLTNPSTEPSTFSRPM
jgi:hypothetical protein